MKKKRNPAVHCTRWLGSRSVTIRVSDALLGDLSEIEPEGYDLAIREWSSKHHVQCDNAGDRLLPGWCKIPSNRLGLIKVTVGCDESRFEHPVLKFVEYFNILRKVLVIWCHIMWCGDLLPNAKVNGGAKNQER